MVFHSWSGLFSFLHVVGSSGQSIKCSNLGCSWLLKALSYGLGSVLSAGMLVGAVLRISQDRRLTAHLQSAIVISSIAHHRMFDAITALRSFLSDSARAWNGTVSPDARQRFVELVQDSAVLRQNSTAATQSLVAVFIASALMVAVVDVGSLALTLLIRRQIRESIRELSPQQLYNEDFSDPAMRRPAAPTARSAVHSISLREAKPDHRANRLRELQRVEKMQMIVSLLRRVDIACADPLLRHGSFPSAR